MIDPERDFAQRVAAQNEQITRCRGHWMGKVGRGLLADGETGQAGREPGRRADAEGSQHGDLDPEDQHGRQHGDAKRDRP